MPETRLRIDLIIDRLIVLLGEEPSPRDTMLRIARRLTDKDLCDHWPKPNETAFQFAHNILEDNIAAWDCIASMGWPDDLSAIESAEELISLFLPSAN